MKKRTILLIALLLVALATMGCSLCPLIPSGPSGPSGGEGRASITLVNQGDETICFVYISPSSSDEWGEDQLGALEVIDPGEQRTFEVEPGTYDLMATDCDDNELDVEWEVEVTSAVTWTVP